jgi:hypothetical protein
LQAALPGGDGDHVEELNRLVGESREGLLRGENGDATTDVAGERLNVLQRGQLDLARAGDGSEFLEIKFRIAGNDGKEMLTLVRARDERFENLLGRQAARSSYEIPSASSWRAALVLLGCAVLAGLIAVSRSATRAGRRSG